MAAASPVDSRSVGPPMGTILPESHSASIGAAGDHGSGDYGGGGDAASAAPCPICERLARRVHSHYTRAVTDVPWHAVSFRLELHVRRFFCDCPDCPRHIFTERLPGVVAPYARRTQRLAAWVRAVGFALGGNAGMRLLSALGVVASADTLVREVRRTTLPPAPACQVVSVDDWCLRRGQTYGAILVDLERRQVIDLLPDREADTFPAWLKSQPQIRVISRDRDWRDRGANSLKGRRVGHAWGAAGDPGGRPLPHPEESQSRLCSKCWDANRPLCGPQPRSSLVHRHQRHEA